MNCLQMVGWCWWRSMKSRTAWGELDMRAWGTLRPHLRASSSCTDLLLIMREAVYLLMHQTGIFSSRNRMQKLKERYSVSANFLSASQTLGLCAGCSGRLIQTTSPFSTVYGPSVILAWSSNNREACSRSVHARPVQHTTSYPALSRAHLIGTVWLSFSGATMMIFIWILHECRCGWQHCATRAH